MAKKKVVLLIPSYENAPVAHFASVYKLLVYRSEAYEVVDVLVAPGLYVDKNRNELAKVALQTEAEYFMWLDSDVSIPPAAIETLLAVGQDIVTGIYIKKRGNWPTIYIYNKEAGGLTNQIIYAMDQPLEVDVMGFGCVLIHRKVFEAEAMKPPWFAYDAAKDETEDASWCRRAKDAGFKIWAEPRLQVAHVWAEQWCYQPQSTGDEKKAG